MFDPAEILARQHADGGWPYRLNASSWTEPTCYALLALAASGLASSDAVTRGSRWLARLQRPGGGFAPRESIAESTWVTALALLLPPEAAQGLDWDAAESWLFAQTGRESGWVYRLRLLLMGERSDASLSYDGWPWYPGAAAWTIPTALSILALEKLARKHSSPELTVRLAEGRSFLLARRCRDGGWNHGSTKALGYDSDSYPETTGLALLALHGSQDPRVVTGIARAEQHLASCPSLEARNWLRLGLLSHGEKRSAETTGSHGQTMEIALTILTDCAQQGRNLFLN